MPEMTKLHGRPLRSLLFVPGTDARKVAKAFASAADAVVLDLEDAVALSEKAAARAAVLEHLQGERTLPVFVRINALDTAYSLEDMTGLIAAAPEGIILPKVESRDMVVIADWIMTQCEQAAGLPQGGVELVPIIETARGLQCVATVAGAVPRVRRLAFGAVDLALDMDLAVGTDDAVLAPARFVVAQASRAGRCEGPIDTAFIHVKEGEALRQTSGNARALGFGGKFCIHPDQIDIVNAAFTATDEELERAGRIVATFEAAEAGGSGAVAFEGMMLDYPVVAKARRILGSRDR